MRNVAELIAERFYPPVGHEIVGAGKFGNFRRLSQHCAVLTCCEIALRTNGNFSRSTFKTTGNNRSITAISGESRSHTRCFISLHRARVILFVIILKHIKVYLKWLYAASVCLYLHIVCVLRDHVIVALTRYVRTDDKTFCNAPRTAQSSR